MKTYRNYKLECKGKTFDLGTSSVKPTASGGWGFFAGFQNLGPALSYREVAAQTYNIPIELFRIFETTRTERVIS